MLTLGAYATASLQDDPPSLRPRTLRGLPPRTVRLVQRRRILARQAVESRRVPPFDSVNRSIRAQSDLEPSGWNRTLIDEDFECPRRERWALARKSKGRLGRVPNAYQRSTPIAKDPAVVRHVHAPNCNLGDLGVCDPIRSAKLESQAPRRRRSDAHSNIRHGFSNLGARLFERLTRASQQTRQDADCAQLSTQASRSNITETDHRRDSTANSPKHPPSLEI